MGWLLLLATTPPTFASGLVDTEHPCLPDLDVNIDLQCGSVAVRGSDRKTVRITGQVDDPTGLSVVPTQGRVGIAVASQGMHKNCAQLVVDVPAHASVVAESVSADLRVDGVGGRLQLESVSGTIAVGGAPAGVDASSVSGSVTIAGGVPGNVNVETVSGSVTLSQIAGAVSAESVSGTIAVTTGQALPQVKLETMSAPITLTARIGPHALWSADSHTGAITVTVPTDASAAFTWSTFAGTVNCSGAAPSANAVTFGAGEGQVQVNTFTGPIRIVRSD